MEYRELGRTGMKVSVVSFGAWAIGSDWGQVNDKESLAALNRAVDLGVNFIDTADVYGDGRSEKLIGQLLKERKEEVFVATKAGRRLDPHVAEGYTLKEIESFVDRSLKNLQVDSLDLLQLHCPPTPVYSNPEVYRALDQLKSKGKIRNYGVSVEKISEALTSIQHPDIQSVQIIFNMLRFRPTEEFFPKAKERKVGVLARVPLASGLLTGKMTSSTVFPREDHRNYNLHGEAFDRGETFSGVDLDNGLAAVEELKRIVPKGMDLTQMALRWILMFDAVTCAIPGAKRVDQVEDNVKAGDLPPLDAVTMTSIEAVYDRWIRAQVHDKW
jgi:aryl-alcohol dehydrogenase-like predicted oxidoreductase